MAFYDPVFLGQSRFDDSDPYMLPGRHTSTIDNGLLTQSPFSYDQPQVQANLMRQQAHPAVQVPQPPDPMEILSQRYRSIGNYRDMLSGQQSAGTSGLKFIDDPLFQNLNPDQQNAFSQRVSGHTLDQQVQADEIARRMGKPVTWNDIADAQFQQKNQASSIAKLRALGQFLNQKNLGDILSTYDPQTGSARIKQFDKITGGALDDAVVHYPPSVIADLQRNWLAAGFPNMRPETPAAIVDRDKEARRMRFEALKSKAAQPHPGMTEAQADAMLNYRGPEWAQAFGGLDNYMQ